MNDEHLIEFVRQCPVLYDPSNPKYSDSSFKNEIWIKIGDEIETDGLTCKTRWNNIRDNFRKSLKRNERSGKSGKKIKLYKYADQLDFLRSYFDERDTKSSIEYDEESTETGNVGTEVYTEDETESVRSPPSKMKVVEKSTIRKTNVRESSSQTASSPQNIEEIEFKRVQSPPSIGSSFNNPNIKKKKKIIAPESSNQTAGSTLIQYLIKQSEASSAHKEQHPVDAFLSGMAPALKTLSPYRWHLAKSELFATVQKYELATLTEQQTDQSVSTLSGPPSGLS